jgi:hypothetical protein
MAKDKDVQLIVRRLNANIGIHRDSLLSIVDNMERMMEKRPRTSEIRRFYRLCGCPNMETWDDIGNLIRNELIERGELT